MRPGIVAAMARAYRDPRTEMARLLGVGSVEAQALAHLFLACGLGLVASLPAAVREAEALSDVPDPLTGVVTAHLFGYLFVAPLFGYALAAALHLAARPFGGRGGFLGARAALFWTALLGAPITLALALLGAAAQMAGALRLLPWLGYLSYAGLAYWLWLLAANVAETEGFGATRRVAAALALAFIGLAVGLGALSGAATAIG